MAVSNEDLKETLTPITNLEETELDSELEEK